MSRTDTILAEIARPGSTRESIAADQKTFHAFWPEVLIVRSVDEALRAVGATK